MYLSRFSFVPATLLCSAALTASASPQELDAAPRPFVTRAAIHPSASALSMAFEYIRGGTPVADNSLGVGYGVDIDPQSGELVLKAPVFTTTAPLGDDSPCTGSVLRFTSHLSNGDSLRHDTLDAGLSGGFGPVKAAAKVQMSDLSSSSDLRSGMSFSYESEWAPKLVDFTNPANFQYTAQAIQVLTAPGLTPEQRGVLWRNQFGRFVIVGYGFTGALGVEVSLSNQSSFQDKWKFLSLDASYGTTSGNLSLGQFTHEALSSTSLTVQRKVVGSVQGNVTLPDIPSIQLLSTTDGQIGFANAFDAAARQIKKRQGIYLQPATSLPFGTYPVPSFTIGSWDLIVQTDASGVADRALKALMQASALLHPLSLRNFVASRTSTSTGASLASDIESQSVALMYKLDDLYRAAVAYEADPTNAGLRLALIAATQSVVPFITTLEGSRDQVLSIGTSLPPITISVSEDWSTSSPPYTGSTGQWIVTVDNFIGFPDGPMESLRSFLITGNPTAPNDSPFVIYADYSGAPNYLCTSMNPIGSGHYQLENLSIDTFQIHQSGPSKGLAQIQFRAAVHLQNATEFARIKVRDMLFRERTLAMNVGSESVHSTP